MTKQCRRRMVTPSPARASLPTCIGLGALKPDEPPSSLVGQVVGGKWRVIKKIGEGGSAIIYEAVHRNHRRGALKVLKAELVDHEDARERFLFEAHVANQVDHRGIIHVLDDDTLEDGRPYLVMELLEGETLEHRLAREKRALDPIEACKIGVEILEALEAVHQAGIVHRDLKPDNVFVTTTGALKLLDFGIARASRLSALHRTYGGIAMGTPGYMPFEQACGNWSKVDERADLWAAGALLFKLLTARRVHEGETAHAELLAAMTVAAPAIRSVAPTTPARLAEVIDKALESRPTNRWRTAREMREALADVLDELLMERREAVEWAATIRAAVPTEDWDEDRETVRPGVRRSLVGKVVATLVLGAAAVVGLMGAVSYAIPSRQLVALRPEAARTISVAAPPAVMVVPETQPAVIVKAAGAPPVEIKAAAPPQQRATAWTPQRSKTRPPPRTKRRDVESVFRSRL